MIGIPFKGFIKSGLRQVISFAHEVLRERKSYDELIDYVALARLNGKSVAFWGWDPIAISALERENLLKGLKTIFIAEHYPIQDMEKCEITQEYYSIDQVYQTPEKMIEFKPDKICILYQNQYEAIRAYEIILRKYEQNPMNIFLTRSVWAYSDYVEGDIYNKLVASVPKNIVGGLVPKSRLALYDGLRYIIKNNVPGRIINFGVSRGWSTYFIAKVLEHFGDTERQIVAFDSFSGFPQNASRYDLCYLRYAKYIPMYTTPVKSQNKKQTEHNLSDYMHRISLVDGDINETILQLGEEPIALALFDMDDYTPTKVSLEPTFRLLSPNGVFIMDRFNYDTVGCFCVGQRIAMLEFLEKHPMFGYTGTNMFLKTGT